MKIKNNFQIIHFSKPISASFAFWRTSPPHRWLSSAFFGIDLSRQLWEEVEATITNETPCQKSLNIMEELPMIWRYVNCADKTYFQVINYLFNFNSSASRVHLLPTTYVRLDTQYLEKYEWNKTEKPSDRTTLNETRYVHFSNEKPFYKPDTKTYTTKDRYQALFHKFWAIQKEVC